MGGEGGGGVPGLRDDDVVDWGVAFAEAGEADFEDHFFWVRGGSGEGEEGGGRERERVGMRVELIFVVGSFRFA